MLSGLLFSQRLGRGTSGSLLPRSAAPLPTTGAILCPLPTGCNVASHTPKPY